MNKCEICKKDIYEGHVMFDYEFKLCSECFDKFYGVQDLEEFMYDNEYQFYTYFEEENESDSE